MPFMAFGHGLQGVPTLRVTLRRSGWAGVSFLAYEIADNSFKRLQLSPTEREELHLRRIQTRAKWESQLRALAGAFVRADELNDFTEKEYVREEPASCMQHLFGGYAAIQLQEPWSTQGLSSLISPYFWVWRACTTWAVLRAASSRFAGARYGEALLRGRYDAQPAWSRQARGLSVYA